MTIWGSSKELSEKKGPPSETLLLARPSSFRPLEAWRFFPIQPSENPNKWRVKNSQVWRSSADPLSIKPSTIHLGDFWPPDTWRSRHLPGPLLQPGRAEMGAISLRSFFVSSSDRETRKRVQPPGKTRPCFSIDVFSGMSGSSNLPREGSSWPPTSALRPDSASPGDMRNSCGQNLPPLFRIPLRH